MKFKTVVKQIKYCYLIFIVVLFALIMCADYPNAVLLICLSAALMIFLLVKHFVKFLNDMKILECPEDLQRPTIYNFADLDQYANAEEESVNKRYKEYIEYKNNDNKLRALYTDLEMRYAAAKHIGFHSERKKYKQQMKVVKNSAVDKVPSIINLNNLNVKFNNDNLVEAFIAMKSFFPKEYKNRIFSETENDYLLPLSNSDGNCLLLTPMYYLVCDHFGKGLSLNTYDCLNVSVDTEVSMKSYPGKNDEIIRPEYRYTNKDGTRNMRYRADNNPIVGYVTKSYILKMSYDSEFCFENITGASVEKFEAFLAEAKKNKKEISSWLYPDSLSGVQNVLEREKLPSGNKETSEKTNEYQPNEQLISDLCPDKSDWMTSTTCSEIYQKTSCNKASALEMKNVDFVENKGSLLNKNSKKEAEKVSGLSVPTKVKQNQQIIKEEKEETMVISKNELVFWKGVDKECDLSGITIQKIQMAFRDNKVLESVIIPEGVVEIAAHAFENCDMLEKVVLPSTLTIIGDSAFKGCTRLVDINLPSGLSEISESVFYMCESLENINIPDGVIRIKDNAFYGCYSLKKIYLPDSVTEISEKSFVHCFGIKEINIPDGVSQITDRLLWDCGDIEKITFGEGITHIPCSVLSDRYKLKRVICSTKLTTIGEHAFRNCESLKWFYPKGGNEASFLEIIQADAFKDCSSLKGFPFGDKVKEIGDRAFMNCKSLDKIKLVDCVKLGDKVFEGCESLREIQGTVKNSWFYNQRFQSTPWLSEQAKDDFIIIQNKLYSYTGKSEKVVIPENVLTICTGAFINNNTITEVYIPDGMETIEWGAFKNCSSLEIVQIPKSVTLIKFNAFIKCEYLSIQCWRGSAASRYHIVNKIPAIYLSKEKTATKNDTKSVTASNGLQLSAEETEMILRMRQQKEKQTKDEKEPVIIDNEETWTFAPYRENLVKIEISLLEDVITNNIFSIAFIQKSSGTGEDLPADYEIFVTDYKDNIISDICNLSTKTNTGDEKSKVTCILKPGIEFSRNENYYIVLRYKGDEKQYLSRTECKIDINFVSDFDF